MMTLLLLLEKTHSLQEVILNFDSFAALSPGVLFGEL
jgi:hypothetical protein